MKTQLYGDVGADLYCNCSLISWLLKNIMEITEPIYDPSLLFRASNITALLLCTDDTTNFSATDDPPIEEKITARFKSRDRRFPPTDFKKMDITQAESNIALSQNDYASKMMIIEMNIPAITKLEEKTKISDEGVNILHSDAGILAGFAAGTAPLPSFQASMAFHAAIDNKRTIKTHVDPREVLKRMKFKNMTSLLYQNVNKDTIYLRFFLYTDGSFQNLTKKIANWICHSYL